MPSCNIERDFRRVNDRRDQKRILKVILYGVLEAFSFL